MTQAQFKPAAQVQLKPGKEQSLARRHPWIFSGAIARIHGNPQEGEAVEVTDALGAFLCVGHYQIGTIAVRVLSFEKRNIDQEFYDRRLADAWELRRKIGLADNPQTNAFRLVHGEGDYLPGLVIDFYNGTAVFQAHSVGMHRDREMIWEALRRTLGDRLKAIYNKSEDTLPFKAETGAHNGYVYNAGVAYISPNGNGDAHLAKENGIVFAPDWERGQKTGFFVDQRDNRALLERYSRGRRVLNMFCYTGGFSLYALRGGAEFVHSVDSSERAIELTNRNVALNGGTFAENEGTGGTLASGGATATRHEAFTADAFDYMRRTQTKYDLIILDPPAFAKHHNVLGNALKGYRRLNTQAMRIIETGGLLFTFSCSQVVSKDVFRTMVFAAATAAGRRVCVLHQLTQPADHPVDIYHPEGEYLKGLVLRVI